MPKDPTNFDHLHFTQKAGIVMDILIDGQRHTRQELMDAINDHDKNRFWQTITNIRKRLEPTGVMLLSEYNNVNFRKPYFRLVRKIVKSDA